MAELLSEEIDTKPAPFIGHQLLNVITMGMYDDPLMIYREYVQNAVDSIDAALEEGKIVIGQGRISIQINGDNRSIRIEDNGAGLPRSSAPEFLLNLGHSVKDGSGRRGFRGIGRLGGLAYCQLLRFETRSSEGEEVTVVEWNKGCLDALPESTKRDVGLTGVVREITRVYSRKPSSNDSDHFFRVEMQNVRRFHSDRLMGVRVVRDYLSQVAPVSYDKANFCHADKVENHFAVVPGYRSYEITVNDRKVTRP